MSNEEFKGTKGLWEWQPDRCGGKVFYAHGFLMSPPIIPVDDTRLEGESWISMRDRTECARESAAAEAEANAHLIAAAPDLLEALIMVRDADEDCLKDETTGITSQARNRIDAAIAKALNT